MLRVFRRAEGSWLIDAEEDRYLDLCSSMWQAALGHGRTDIVAAYTRQAERIASAGPIYFTTEGAVELAERIARSTPGDLSRVFLTSSGSEATETAVKLARQYHRLRGDHHRFKFISRYGSYHGAGMGGTSIGGRRRRDSLYYPLVPGTVNIQPPTGTDDIVAAEALRTAIEMEGPGDRRGVHRRAGGDHAVHHPRRRLLAARPRDLRRVRRPADRRRDADRAAAGPAGSGGSSAGA